MSPHVKELKNLDKPVIVFLHGSGVLPDRIKPISIKKIII